MRPAPRDASSDTLGDAVRDEAGSAPSRPRARCPVEVPGRGLEAQHLAAETGFVVRRRRGSGPLRLAQRGEDGQQALAQLIGPERQRALAPHVLGLAGGVSIGTAP